MNSGVFQVLSDVMGIPIEEVNDESSPDNVPGWDSASHVHLILALETEFSVVFSPEDAMEMLTVGAIRAILTRINSLPSH